MPHHKATNPVTMATATNKSTPAKPIAIVTNPSTASAIVPLPNIEFNTIDIPSQTTPSIIPMYSPNQAIVFHAVNNPSFI